MRKLFLAALVTVSALAAAPAMADSAYPYQQNQGRDWDRDRDGRNDRLEDRAYDQRFDRDRDGRHDRLEDRAFDQRFNDRSGYGYSPRQYSQWYPGWQHSWYENRHVLPPHRLIRKIERQGYFGVRTLGFGRRGVIRAMAFDKWRRPVTLRVDPYTGIVIRVMPA
jgi:hypothetical protein